MEKATEVGVNFFSISLPSQSFVIEQENAKNQGPIKNFPFSSYLNNNNFFSLKECY